MRPLISAHQGACGVEGLSAAERYRRAIAMGVDFVEFDVRRTADGLYVIHHDERTASGRSIRDSGFAELAGELGGEALTFDELLDIAGDRVGLQLDLKEPGYEAQLVSMALRRCAPERLVVTTGDDASIRLVKETFPQVGAGLTMGDYLTSPRVWLDLAVRMREFFPRRRLERCHADFVAAHRQLAQFSMLSYCKRANMPAWVWTVDDEPGIARFLADSRVTVLITNRPDIAMPLRRP